MKMFSKSCLLCVSPEFRMMRDISWDGLRIILSEIRFLMQNLAKSNFETVSSLNDFCNFSFM